MESDFESAMNEQHFFISLLCSLSLAPFPFSFSFGESTRRGIEVGERVMDRGRELKYTNTLV